MGILGKKKKEEKAQLEGVAGQGRADCHVDRRCSTVEVERRRFRSPNQGLPRTPGFRQGLGLQGLGLSRLQGLGLQGLGLLFRV